MYATRKTSNQPDATTLPVALRAPRQSTFPSQVVDLTFLTLLFHPHRPARGFAKSLAARMSTFPSHHDSRSERLSWGNQLVAGLTAKRFVITVVQTLGSPLSATPNSDPPSLPLHHRRRLRRAAGLNDRNGTLMKASALYCSELWRAALAAARVLPRPVPGLFVFRACVLHE